jgi:hypothetical protein
VLKLTISFKALKITFISLRQPDCYLLLIIRLKILERKEKRKKKHKNKHNDDNVGKENEWTDKIIENSENINTEHQGKIGNGNGNATIFEHMKDFDNVNTADANKYSYVACTLFDFDFFLFFFFFFLVSSLLHSLSIFINVDVSL